MPSPSVLVATKLPADLAAALKQRATQTDRSVSAEIRTALRAHLSLNSEAAPAGGSAEVSDDTARLAA